MIKEGFASLPREEQIRVIQSIYPEISEAERIMANLLLKGAIDEKTAIPMPKSSALVELVEAEHIIKTSDTKYYLTSDGKMITMGALLAYPELGRSD
jgi:hypothetical protein